jgi:protein-L-isoaspartate(D-aspartate) O-methyltransferase
VCVTQTMSQVVDHFTPCRQRMVDDQLRARGICDSRVLAAMLTVSREEFVFSELREQAYDDCPKPIGAGQTISQPFAVAYMAEMAQLRGDEKILEVGTGSGYGAAVLSLLGAEVHTVERLPALGKRASATLRRLGYSNVQVYVGDGSLGLATEAPYDAIIVTASAAYLPPAYIEQLAEGGRIVIPIGKFDSCQHLYRICVEHGEEVRDDLGAFAFVPLLGDEGWPPT